MPEMSDNERLEYDRLRLAEAVTASVDKAMKWRYTGLALVFSFLIGGGIATAVNTLLDSTKATLTKAQVALTEMSDQAVAMKKLSAESQNQLKDLNDQIEKLSQQVAEKSKGLDEALARSGVNLQNITDITSQLSQLTSRV